MRNRLMVYGRWLSLTQQFLSCLPSVFLDLPLRAIGVHLGLFSAFIIALFVEMYGFPLTIYLLSGWLQTRFPQLDLLSHNAGHLWSTLLGEKGDPHFGILHIASYVFLGYGFLFAINSHGRCCTTHNVIILLAVTGPYARIRHPQYVAFVMILLGFLLQWPTLLTLIMFPILLLMYSRLAIKEEAENE